MTDVKGSMLLVFLSLLVTATVVRGEDPTFHFEWNVTYGTLSPLGVPQQVILINGQFPGPNINATSNNNLIFNIFNNIDEPFLITWAGVQQRKNSWVDGVPGTNCPIPPGKNQTFKLQVKDQIGSYIYYPSTSMHKASGGYGGLRINSRLLIPVPYPDPADDYTVHISDWFNGGHAAVRKTLDGGQVLGPPDGVLLNGKAAKGDGSDEPLFVMKPGLTYRYRICNAGIKSSLNFRIQGHPMKLVEMEGSHVVQNTYDSLDVHCGQCFTVLVHADKEPKDYVMVASTRFEQKEVIGKGIIRYEGGKGPAAPELPPGPAIDDFLWSLNQFRSFRWNLTASAARPNPQGSYHYGKINITRTIRLVTTSGDVDGKLRYAISGVSHVDPDTPLKLAEAFNISDKVFKYEIIKDSPPETVDTDKIQMTANVLKQTYRDFVEIIIENHEKTFQSWHLNGYSFFAVASEPGTWSVDKRKHYNLLDAVSRHTIQVFPKSWAAIMLTFDNAGVWNLRSEIAERRYLGQQLYISVLPPGDSSNDELNMPEDVLLCGAVKDMGHARPALKSYRP